MERINWREVLSWNQDQIEDLRFIGYAYIRQGKYDIALPIYQALTVLDPDNAYDSQTLGAILLELGKPNDALIHFDKALKLEADHAPTLINLAKALFMIGKNEEGLKLAQILAREPSPQIARIAKALILAYG